MLILGIAVDRVRRIVDWVPPGHRKRISLPQPSPQIDLAASRTAKGAAMWTRRIEHRLADRTSFQIFGRGSHWHSHEND